MSNQWREHLADWGMNAEEFRAGWRPLLFFDLLFKLLSAAVLAPLSGLFLNGILRWSGDRAISNFDLVAFFLSPQGLLLIVVSATLGFAVIFFELGGLAMIVLAIRENKKPSVIKTLWFLGSHFRRLCILGLRQFFILGGIAAVVLAIAFLAKSALLGGGDIYFYLQTRPPKYWLALAIAGTAGLAAGILGLILLIRWAFSVPLLLIEGRGPREAMRESGTLVRSAGAGNIAKKLAAWGVGSLILLAAAGGIQRALERVLGAIAGNRVEWVIASTALLQAIGLVVGTFAALVIAVAFAAMITRLFSDACPESEVPESLASDRREADGKAPRRIRWLVFGSASGLMLLAGGFAWFLVDQIRIGDDVAVTAHRGSSLSAPENTRAAVVRAVEEGSDYVEIDVQETADGIVVLIHDTDLRRLAGINRNTWEIPYAEFREFDIGSWFSPEFSGERIMTLAEAIELVRGRSKLNIELKFNGHDKQLEAAVEKIVRETGFEDDCIVMSLEYRAVQEIARLNDRLETGLTLTAGVGDPTHFDVDFLAVNANSVTRELVTRAHRAGIEIHVWTVNDPAQMLAMIHLGVDNIITDAPDLLVELLRERAELTNAEKTLLYLSDFLAGRL